jgi:Cof subfamily protein (haloacid dehalogenase superfamily)
MKTNKVIATDLDGTLFYPRKRVKMISKENRAFINRFLADGGRLLIVSSRNRYFSDKVSENLGHPIDTVGCNGAFVVSNGEVIKETYFQPGLIRKILSEMRREWHLPLVILDSKHRNMVLTQTGVSSVTNIMYFAYQLVQGVYREPFVRSDKIFYEEIEKGEVYKLLIMFGVTHKKIMETMEINKLLRVRYPEAEFSWMGQGIEVTPKGCSKAEGIAFYLDYNKIDRDNVIVVGDSGNDISMFEEYKANSFCLSHGRDIVKKHAAHIIDRFSDLEKYIYPSEEITVSEPKKEGK